LAQEVLVQTIPPQVKMVLILRLALLPLMEEVQVVTMMGQDQHLVVLVVVETPLQTLVLLLVVVPMSMQEEQGILIPITVVAVAAQVKLVLPVQLVEEAPALPGMVAMG
jgi:NADH:ubiquinone oxidoreductase subunit K